MLSKVALFNVGNVKYRICLSVCLVIIFASPLFAGLPDTGQTKCYDDKKEISCPKPGQDFYGQDGNYTINPPSYTLLGGGAMVKDNVTGLIWENKTTDGSIHDTDKRYSWHDARNVFIAQLNASKFGGYDDWRLPTREELRSIIDYGRSPHINTEYFPNTGSDHYWSSSAFVNNAAAWRVGFDNSNDHYPDTSLKSCARAVRGGQSSTSDNLVVNNDGTVTDKNNGLMWQQVTGNNDQLMIWKDALSYCENLTFASYTDWRLPNIKELASLVDLSRYQPAIHTKYFSNTRLNYYWSSTSFADNTWNVSFEGGYSGYDKDSAKSNKYYVRCVRGGQ